MTPYIYLLQRLKNLNLCFLQIIEESTTLRHNLAISSDLIDFCPMGLLV